MPSRQDQLHSYQYSLQRVVAALVTHDPDPARSPLRKAGTTALVSLLVASIAVAAAAIYGLFTGQSTANPTDTDVVFQEKGTGARYVYLSSDKKLHPVLNYVSGMLLAQGNDPSMESITSEKLATVPLGAALGIPGAPDSLPAAGSLLSNRWSVCTDSLNPGNKPRSTLLVGDTLTDGEVLATEATPRGVLVVNDKDVTMLIYNNHSFTIPADLVQKTLLLTWNNAVPFPVSTAWTDAIPAGHQMAAPQISGMGDPTVIPGVKVGDLLENGSEDGYAIALADGIAPVTPLQSRLLRAEPGIRGPIPRNDYASLPESKKSLIDSGAPESLPSDLPALIDTTPNRICFTSPVTEKVDGKTVTDGIRIDPTIPTTLTPVTAKPTSSKTFVDEVHVPRGKGVVVVGVPGQATDSSAGAAGGTYSIVTDTGYSYPLASHDLLSKLGYDGVTPQRVPTEFTDLLPMGAALDPAAALKPSGD